MDPGMAESLMVGGGLLGYLALETVACVSYIKGKETLLNRILVKPFFYFLSDPHQLELADGTILEMNRREQWEYRLSENGNDYALRMAARQ